MAGQPTLRTLLKAITDLLLDDEDPGRLLDKVVIIGNENGDNIGVWSGEFVFDSPTEIILEPSL